RVWVAPARRDVVEHAREFDLGVGMEAMLGLRSDQPYEVQAFGGHVFLHHVARLLLRVELAVVFDGRRVEEIGGVIGGVVKVEELLLPGERCIGTGQVHLLVECRFGKSRAWRYRGPESGEVRADMPCGCSAHAEATDQDPVLVDRELSFYRRQRLEE